MPAAAATEDWWTQSLEEGVKQRAACGERRAAAGAAGPRSQRIARSSRLPEVLNLLRRLCAALAYLHGEGIVHRDRKPDNVLVRPAGGPEAPPGSLGMPVLADFGLVGRFGGAEGREALEPEALGVGTAYYVAPEQARGESVDARADLYALGCILYELLAGRPPFLGQTAGEVVWQHPWVEPVPPSRVAAGAWAGQEVPWAGLDELTLRLLAKDPRQRLGYADAVAAALGRLVGGSQRRAASGERAADEGPDASGERALPRPRAYLYRPGLVGRQAALAEIERQLGPEREQPAALVLVGGESGVGKTRLMLELARRAERRRVRVLTGECVPGVASGELRVASQQQSDSSSLATRNSQLATVAESARAPRGRSDRSPSWQAGGYGPLEALRRPLQAAADHCRAAGPAETERVLGRRGRVLALYEPALRGLPWQEAYPEPADPPPDAARLRLFADLAETFEEMAGRTAQERAQHVAPLLLFLDDLQWADDLTLGFLEHWLRASRAGGRTASVQIAATYRSEDVDMGQPDVGAAHASRLRGLVDGAGIVSIGLGRAARRLVNAASVVGREVGLELLGCMVRLGKTQLFDALQELLSRQVFEVPAPGTLRFVHDKLREVAYQGLRNARRKKLHHAAAQAIESVHAIDLTEHQAALGHHWELAGSPDKARFHYLAAARTSDSRNHLAEAEQLYGAYFALVDGPTQESVQAGFELGERVLSRRGLNDEALDMHQVNLEHARYLGDRRLESLCFRGLGNVYRGATREPPSLGWRPVR